MPRQSGFIRASALLITLTLSASTALPAFQLDPTFGNGGRVTVSFPDSTNLYRSFGMRIWVQPTGRIVAGGSFTNNGPDGQFPGVAFVGLTSSGMIDTSFGSFGKVLDFNPIAFTSFSDAYMYPDGRTLRVSQVLSLTFPQSIPKAVRLNENGSPDTTFNGNANVGALAHIPLEVAVTPDAKVLVLTDDEAHTLYRLNPDGTRDKTFGTDGAFTISFSRVPGPKFDILMTVLADGRIMLAGHIGDSAGDSYTEFFLMRLSSQGHVDKSFGRQGIFRSAFGVNMRGSVRSMILQPDGRILLAGGITNPDRDTWMMRFSSNGKPDGSFGSAGVVVTDFASGEHDEANAVILSADGKLRIAGQAGNVANFVLARYSVSGALEEQIQTPFTAGHASAANDLTFQSDGKILLIGFTRNPDASVNGDVFAIARFTE